jgi:hypothetical protein
MKWESVGWRFVGNSSQSEKIDRLIELGRLVESMPPLSGLANSGEHGWVYQVKENDNPNMAAKCYIGKTALEALHLGEEK